MAVGHREEEEWLGGVLRPTRARRAARAEDERAEILLVFYVSACLADRYFTRRLAD
jgi:hypothetical protein